MATKTYNERNRHLEEIIRKEYASRKTEDLAAELGMNYYTLSRMASRLGVRKSDGFMHTSWKKGGWRKGLPKKRAEEKDAYMREHFADTRNEELARHFHVDVKTVRRWARRLGLAKSETFMRDARASAWTYHKRYTPEYEEWRRERIAEIYPDATDEEQGRLAEELGLSVRHLRRVARKVGVGRSEQRTREMHEKAVLKRTIFTPELVTAIGEYYPTHTNKEVAEHFGINIGSLNQVAVRYGMKKTKEHKHTVYSNLRKRSNKPEG